MTLPLEQIDMERIAERFDAYWGRVKGTGPFVAIRSYFDGRKPPGFPVPDTVEARWMDIEYQCNKALYEAENNLCLGDAFPAFMPQFGPHTLAAFLGGELTFPDDRSSWLWPFVDDLADWTPVLDPSNKWWRHICELLDAMCEVAPGRFLVATPVVHAGGDSLPAVREPGKLALDLYDRPDEVKRIMRTMTDMSNQIYEHYFSRISRVQDGYSTWLKAYSRGRYAALQNDFSALVSPAMFAEFFLPEIEELVGHLDNSLYHLDGPDALAHLACLLEIEALDGIQWEPGAGARPMSRWVDVCRQILEAGKCLLILCEPDGVEHMLAELPREGLFVITRCATEAEARGLYQRIKNALS